MVWGLRRDREYSRSIDFRPRFPCNPPEVAGSIPRRASRVGARHVTGVGDMPQLYLAGISNAKVGSYCKVTNAEGWERLANRRRCASARLRSSRRLSEPPTLYKSNNRPISLWLLQALPCVNCPSGGLVNKHLNIYR